MKAGMVTTKAPPPPETVYTTVRFYLKPHLHGFALRFVGGTVVDAVDTNAIGAMALSCLTRKSRETRRESKEFPQGRQMMEARISIRMMEAHGYDVSCVSMSRFEKLVEHLFYHMMLVYVDTEQDNGTTQNNAIRKFLDRYSVDLATVEFDSIKKTIIRRRARVNTAPL
jgi:hypothetical protein